jgi:uncharacterized iron-regulated protein
MIVMVLGLLLWISTVFLESFGGSVLVYRTADYKTITLEEMVRETSSADIIFAGELHNTERHHRLQLLVIRRLADAGLPVAIGLEMFPKESQKTLDEWVAGELSSIDFMRAFELNWGYPWTLYKDIFLFARENEVPLVALNIPREVSRKVRESGFSSLSEKELEQLPPDLTCDVDEEYMDYIRRVFSYHEHQSINENGSFVNFCEAQLLWDKSMAWYLLEYLDQNPGRKIVVLTGITHAWKKGIPAQLERLSDEVSYRVALPEIPIAVEPDKLTTDDADYIFLK